MRGICCVELSMLPLLVCQCGHSCCRISAESVGGMTRAMAVTADAIAAGMVAVAGTTEATTAPMAAVSVVTMAAAVTLSGEDTLTADTVAEATGEGGFAALCAFLLSAPAECGSFLSFCVVLEIKYFPLWTHFDFLIQHVPLL